MKIFAHLGCGATFDMVPLEAASCGTPVLYRYMPQSLTEYLGLAGIQCGTIAELEYNTRRLYTDKLIWEAGSVASRLAARAHAGMPTGRLIGLALENMCLREQTKWS